MNSNKLSMLALISIACLAGLVSAGGKKDYDEECSMLSQVSNVFTKDENDDPNACNTDKGLVCLGKKCSCGTNVYEKGYFGGIFGGGSCKNRANLPCRGDAGTNPCVSNAKCGDGTSAVSICSCAEGYHATTDGFCSNGSNALNSGMTPIYLTGLIFLTYFIYSP